MNSRPTTTCDDTPQPARRVVASYADHRDAEKAVDYLASNRFPVEHVGTLVGTVMGLVMYLITKSRRRLEAVSTMQPAYFDIAVDDMYADDAARIPAAVARNGRAPPTLGSAVRPPRPTPAT